MINLKYAMSGRYKIIARKSDGSERLLADWFDNLITDNGLNLCATAVGSPWTNSSVGMLRYCVVGSGSDTPLVTDVQLQTLVASKLGAGSVTGTVNTTERYFSFMADYTFGEGVAEGNISEVGVGMNTNDLFSRALITDSSGNPTTITVLSDEFLVITYELRVYQPTGDNISSVDGYTVTVRSALVDNSGISNNDRWSPRPFRLISITNTSPRISTSEIVVITSDPSGGVVSTDFSDDAYVSESFTRTSVIVYSPSEANQNTASLMFAYGPGYFQCGFSPTINKNNTQRLTLTVRLTWGRQGELPS